MDNPLLLLRHSLHTRDTPGWPAAVSPNTSSVESRKCGCETECVNKRRGNLWRQQCSSFILWNGDFGASPVRVSMLLLIIPLTERRYLFRYGDNTNIQVTDITVIVPTSDLSHKAFWCVREFYSRCVVNENHINKNINKYLPQWIFHILKYKLFGIIKQLFFINLFITTKWLEVQTFDLCHLVSKQGLVFLTIHPFSLSVPL